MTDKARELLELALKALEFDVSAKRTDEIKKEIRAYLAEPRPEFVRLSEEEVSEILSLAHTPYEAICAAENRLARKNA